MDEFAPDVFLQRHPLRMMGCQLGRVVTAIRLRSGDVVLHSTADFSETDRVEIENFGDVRWLVEASNFHDTYSEIGRSHFPNADFLTPPGFRFSGDAKSLSENMPREWADEIEVHEIGGLPKLREQAVFHRPSQTLILADLFFNLPPTAGAWTQGFLRATAGIRAKPSVSRLFKLLIRDRAAFRKSIRQIAELDFEKIVVAHSEPVSKNGKEIFLQLAEENRWL